jgi:hypothetical protein
MFTDSSTKVDWGNATLLQEKNNAQTCGANVYLIKVPQTNIVSVLSSPFPPNLLPDNTLVVLVERLADPKSDSCPPSNASPRKFPAAHERGDSGIGVVMQYTHICSIGLNLHSTEAHVLHSDAGRRKEHLIRSAGIPSMWTFHLVNRVRVELLFFLVCMCAGISRLHRPSRNAWLFRLAYGKRLFESPTYDPQIGRAKGVMEAGRSVMVDKRGGI